MRSVMRWFFAACILTLGLSPCAAPCGTLDIWCVSGGDNGGGTGTIIKGPNGTVVLFDEGGGATWAGACEDLLDDVGISQIDHAIASHYDSDHINGLDDLTTTIVKCWDRGGAVKSDATPIPTAYMTAVAGKRDTAKVDGTTDINLGDGATLKFLSVGADDNAGDLDDRTFIKGKDPIEAGSENNKSISAVISYGYFDFYVGGDAEGDLEKILDDVIVDDLDRIIDVLHIDHHGSSTYDVSSEEFLAKMYPSVCITSTWNNNFGHPTETVMDRIDAVVDPLLYSNIRLRTGDPDEAAAETPSPPRYTAEGHVHISTAGSSYSIEALSDSGTVSLISYHPCDMHSDYPWPMFRHNTRHTGMSECGSGPASAALGWSYRTDGDVESSAAVGSYEALYVGSADNAFYSLGPSGSIAWSYVTAGDVSSSPAINASQEVYVGSKDNQLYALDSIGRLKWSYSHPAGWASSPVLDSAMAVYAQARTSLVAFDSMGTLEWSYDTGVTTAAHASSPALGDDGRIYWGTGDADRLYALDSNVTLAWSYRMGGTLQSSPAIGTGGNVYIGSYDNRLYACASLGARAWSYLTGGDVYSSPALDDAEKVYVGSRDNNLYSFISTGALSWSYAAGKDMDSSTAIGKTGLVYAGAQDNMIYALNSTGTLLWSYAGGHQFNASPAIGSGGKLFVGSLDNNVYTLGM